MLMWMGMLPMQLSQSAFAVVLSVITMPVDPSPRQMQLHLSLQEVRAPVYLGLAGSSLQPLRSRRLC